MTPARFLHYACQNTPRYTSYPTAPHFHEGVTANTYSRWLAALDSEATGSLYIHIPYCREMCWYCGCSTRATTRREPIAAYLERLTREIVNTAACIPHRATIGHVHFGGGTPTILNADQFTGLMTCLRQVFEIKPDAEIAIEIDPRTFNPDLANSLAHNGFNRASVGVQTFDSEVQAKINRIQPLAKVTDCVDQLRQAGIDRISFDLLYGLPGQTLGSCRNSVATALMLAPDRLSIFGYAHVPHIKRHQSLINDSDLPNAEQRVQQAMAMAGIATSVGFAAVGIDHYAKSDDTMNRLAASGKIRRNFQGYTTDQTAFLLGFGASAISRMPKGYAQNTPDVASWNRAIESGQLATQRGVELSDEDRIRGRVIERVMCDLAVDLDGARSESKADIEMPDLSDLVHDGLVIKQGNRLKIPDDCRMLARIVAARFDAYLPANIATRHSASV
jgi:oxygen-independent coproporphyrinogen-3 oxidase